MSCRARSRPGARPTRRTPCPAARGSPRARARHDVSSQPWPVVGAHDPQARQPALQAVRRSAAAASPVAIYASLPREASVSITERSRTRRGRTSPARDEAREFAAADHLRCNATDHLAWARDRADRGRSRPAPHRPGAARPRGVHPPRGTAGTDPGRLDGVLISHLHHDHLDRPSLRHVAGSGVAARAALRGGAAALRHAVRGRPRGAPGGRAGRGRRTDRGRSGLARWPPAAISGAKVHDALGLVTEGVWFAGETDLHEDMEALRGRVDVACCRSGAGGRRPVRAISTRDGRARRRPGAAGIAIPIDWGSFLPIVFTRKHRRLLPQPAERFVAHVAAVAPGTRSRCSSRAARWIFRGSTRACRRASSTR